MYPRDTLRIARDLEGAGIERRHAEAGASAGGRADEQLATKADVTALKTDVATKADVAALEVRVAALESNVTSLRSEFRWVFGFQSALILAMAARLFALV